MQRKTIAMLICTLFFISAFSNMVNVVSTSIEEKNVSIDGIDLVEMETSIKFAPPEEWNRTFGGNWDERGCSVIETSEGNYLITGYTSSRGAGGFDVLLLKTNTYGIELWRKVFGGSDEDKGFSVLEASDGGYLIAGFTNSFDVGGGDVWLIKTYANGNEDWNETYGGTGSQCGYSVSPCGSGYVVVGFDNQWGEEANYDFYVVRIWQDGSKYWSKTYGFDGDDIARGVSGLVVAGWTKKPGSVFSDIYCMELDDSGNIDWDKIHGGSGDDWAESITRTSDWHYVIAGATHGLDSTKVFTDVLLMKIDWSSGNVIWTKTYGGDREDVGRSVQQTSDGGYIITGWTKSFGAGDYDVWLIKTDADGNEQWNMTFGGSGSDQGESVEQTSDGGYIITGYTDSYGAGRDDLWLIKVASENNLPSPPNTPSGPTSGETDVLYSYTTNATDPDNDEVRYYFDWDDGTGNWTGFVGSGQSASKSHAWNNPGTYEIRAKAQDEHGAESEFSSPLTVVITEPGEHIPDLECDGSISWTDVKPGDTVTGNFTVENVGDSGSELDWEVSEYPEWGDWTFTPSQGDDLTPEDEKVTVQVSVVAPDEEEQEFSGQVTVVNKNNAGDYDVIDVSLATPKNKVININPILR